MQLPVLQYHRSIYRQSQAALTSFASAPPTERDFVHSCQARMRASFPPRPLSMTLLAPSMCHPMDSGESLPLLVPYNRYYPPVLILCNLWFQSCFCGLVALWPLAVS